MKGYFMNSLVVISVYYILYTTWTIHSPKYLSTIAPLVAQSVKNLPAVPVDMGLIPGLGKSPGGGHGNPLQYSCLENPHGEKRLMGYNPWGHKRVRHN